jgi:hypothetical protein
MTSGRFALNRLAFWRLIMAACLCAGLICPAAVAAPVAAGTLAKAPFVVEMIAQVQSNAISAFLGSLSGEWPAFIDGDPYTITTRATQSGTPIQKATQYVYERLQAWNLSPAFQDWSMNSYSGRNVTAVITGTTTPDEFVLLTAHLDDAPWTGIAPGADDNASGSVGVLMAAEILSQYRFERTLQFVFFTGEEQGLLGSKRFAAEARSEGRNIVAVCNLDMIAWDRKDGPILQLHTRFGSADDLAIAGAFTEMVNTYSLNLTPVVVADTDSFSDQSSFWGQGYPAILAIEDDRDDINPYYHSRFDRLSNLNQSYFIDIVKAAVGTTATLARPLGATGGDYRARVEPPAVTQWGNPAEVITYALQITNTGNISDTYQLTATQHTWMMAFPAEVGPLAAGASAAVTVTVTIPPDSNGGMADIAVLTVSSLGSGIPVDAAELTTVVNHKMLFFPFVMR